MRRFRVTPLFFLSLWPKPRLFKTGAGVASKTNYLHAENKANQKSDYVIDFFSLMYPQFAHFYTH